MCYTPTKSFQDGDILLFFHLKDDNSHHSQSLITVGVLDGFNVTNQSDELLRLTAKRSVFQQKELEAFTENGTKDVKVINFLLAGHISPAILYAFLEDIGIRGPYQSVRGISHEHFELIKPHLRLNV